MIEHVLSSLSESQRDAIKRLAIVFPFSWRQGRGYRQWRRFLKQAEHWPRERIEAWQLQKLQAIVRYAFDHTEGYRKLYQSAGVSPEDVRSLADIRHLPFTTKQLFQEQLEAFSVRRASRRYVTTGGSTGIPFGFYSARENLAIESAFMHAGWSRFGWKPGVRSATLRGGFVGTPERIWRYDAYRRELNLSSYHLTEKTLPAYIEALHRWKPPILQAYPSSLNLLCDLLRDAKLTAAVSFDLILLGSENVYDWQLEKFERTFPGAKLCSWYGHAEITILAPWCERRRAFHAWPFYGITEILGPDNASVADGQQGELVGTSFHNYTTPFIRYRTMDLATRGGSSCEHCGRNFQVLDRIMGRLHEVIVTPTGRYISMTAINMHGPLFDELRQFQFLQEEPGRVIFKYVAKRPLSPEHVETIRQALMEKLGDEMQLSLVAVDSIPRTGAGKYRFLDQRLPIKYGDR